MEKKGVLDELTEEEMVCVVPLTQEDMEDALEQGVLDELTEEEMVCVVPLTQEDMEDALEQGRKDKRGL